MTPPDDDLKKDGDEVLGIARIPVPQTDADRALGRESEERTGLTPDEVDTSLVKDDAGYGVPKAPPGLHVED